MLSRSIVKTIKEVLMAFLFITNPFFEPFKSFPFDAFPNSPLLIWPKPSKVVEFFPHTFFDKLIHWLVFVLLSLLFCRLDRLCMRVLQDLQYVCRTFFFVLLARIYESLIFRILCRLA